MTELPDAREGWLRRCRQACRSVLVVVCLAIVSAGASPWTWASDALPAPLSPAILHPATLYPATLHPASALDELLLATGVLEQIAAVSGLMDAELRNLQASPLFPAQEITQISELMIGVREDRLYQQIQDAIEQQFSAEELAALQVLSQRPEIRFLQEEESALQESAVQKMPLREQWRLYRLRMKEEQPASTRVEQMQALDQARYNTQFETALKVSLRKNLLAAVAVVKTRQALSDAALDKELSEYRDKLANELREQARITYLFLFRKTPTEAVQATIGLFQDPLYARLMGVCEQALERSFRMAREKSEESLRVAQIGGH